MNVSFRTAALALALAAAAPWAAVAQNADTRDLDAARADLQRAAARLAELTRERIGDGAGAFGDLSRPVLGVVLAADPEAGVRIAAVTPGGAAAAAGLRAGDRLVAVDGHRILGSDGATRLDNARGLIARLEADAPARIGYVRGGREATVSLTPRPGPRIAVLSGDIGSAVQDALAGLDMEALRQSVEQARIDTAGIGADIERALSAAGLDADCTGPDCAMPRLLAAARWRGLNLAAVDAELGRYFGTDRGVLVLSAGRLDGLRAGDVIQRIDGRPVSTPREAMQALRERPANARVEIAYLRDRKPGTVQATVPEVRSLRMPAPPEPPAPPAPPASPKPSARPL
ncbi:PDZ domain-containing protein [Luteimonas huabeiensis]|uniref:PDZ domain-containing protein n=1 Tax=Luteimonas huabeiensis TaxID=1244513 RepID=UPI0004668BF1|nr:PDZ domain-containing protein [Luteimonas huabeiensis]